MKRRSRRSSKANQRFELPTGTDPENFRSYHPGSQEAAARGCTCPKAENNFGRGRTETGVTEVTFTSDPYCRLHGVEAVFGIDLDLNPRVGEIERRFLATKRRS